MNRHDPVIMRLEKNLILTRKDVAYPVAYGMSDFKTGVATVELMGMKG